jgi:hypothetical protein
VTAEQELELMRRRLDDLGAKVDAFVEAAAKRDEAAAKRDKEYARLRQRLLRAGITDDGRK